LEKKNTRNQPHHPAQLATHPLPSEAQKLVELGQECGEIAALGGAWRTNRL
jgi:hypothetical protein